MRTQSAPFADIPSLNDDRAGGFSDRAMALAMASLFATVSPGILPAVIQSWRSLIAEMRSPDGAASRFGDVTGVPDFGHLRPEVIAQQAHLPDEQVNQSLGRLVPGRLIDAADTIDQGEYYMVRPRLDGLERHPTRTNAASHLPAGTPLAFGAGSD
jgi:hypothetical protein